MAMAATRRRITPASSHVAVALGISQPAVSRQLKFAPKLDDDIRGEAVLL
jgi:hypothetical protein